MRATFPAAARLHRPSEYASALKGKRLARGALFVVTTPRSVVPEGTAPGASEAIARLGLIIAKRHANRAVSRNAIKRVIRDAFRKRRHALPPRDLVFRLHSKAPAVSLSELKAVVRAEVDTLLDRAMR